MRERVTVVTLSVYHFLILEKAPFSGLKAYISTYFFSYRAFSPLVMVGVAVPILVAMVTVFL